MRNRDEINKLTPSESRLKELMAKILTGLEDHEVASFLEALDEGADVYIVVCQLIEATRPELAKELFE